MNTNAVQLKTQSATNVVIRDASGKKIFDLNLASCSIEVAVPPDATIQVTPSPQCQSDAVVAAVPTRPVVLRALTTEQLAEEVIQAIQRMSPARKARARRAFRPAAQARQRHEVIQ